MRDFDQAYIVDEHGEKRPLVGCKMIVVPAREQIVEKEFPLRPRTCAIILFVVTWLVSIIERGRQKIYWGYDLLLMLASGLAGCILDEFNRILRQASPRQTFLESPDYLRS